MLAQFAPSAARAQSAPPITVPAGGPLAADPTAIAVGGWQLRGAVDTVVQNSNNYLLTSPAFLSGWSVGFNPHGTAEWSNGIHSTVLYASYERLEYKTLATDDAEVTARQTYSPLRDLKLSIEGDYTHRTIASALTSSIPGAITTTATTVLPNGNTVLPNGTIVSSTGQIVGQSVQTAGVGGNSLVNPYDQYTGTGRIEKIFNGGMVALAGSALQTNYENAGSSTADFSARTFTEDMAFWVGPMIYAYSDGSFSSRTSTPPAPNSSAYRIVGGLGTDKLGLVRLSGYAGHQGSQTNGSGSAEGIVYGGTASYEPTRQWTLSANYDHTTNDSSQLVASTQALSLPNATPLLLPTSTSAYVDAITVRSEYRPSERWAAISFIGYTNARYPDRGQQDTSWIADASLQYELLRNLSLSGEVQYIVINSDRPGISSSRELFIARSSYRF